MKTEALKALKALDTALWRARAAAVRTSDHHIQIGHAIDAFYQLKEALAQPEQEPTNDWSEWRGMVVQNLMRHGIDKDFARRLAHFYQDKAPQPKEPEQRSVSEHLEPVAWLQIGVGPLHEGDVIARTTKPREWNPEWWKFEPLYTTPPQPQSEARGLSQSKPLSGYINGAGINANDLPHIVVEKIERAIKSAHGIKE